MKENRLQLNGGWEHGSGRHRWLFLGYFGGGFLLSPKKEVTHGGVRIETETQLAKGTVQRLYLKAALQAQHVLYSVIIVCT